MFNLAERPSFHKAQNPARDWTACLLKHFCYSRPNKATNATAALRFIQIPDRKATSPYRILPGTQNDWVNSGRLSTGACISIS